MKANNDIRTYAKDNGVALWECAKALGISEATMIRRLREELPDSHKEEIKGIIDDIAKWRI